MITTIKDFYNYVKEEGFTQFEDSKFEKYVKSIDDHLKLFIGYTEERRDSPLDPRSPLCFSATFQYKKDPSLTDIPDYNYASGIFSYESLDDAIERARDGIDYLVKKDSKEGYLF